MSTDIFALLIGVGFVITLAFYTAGLWISLRSGSRCAFTPPAPPALPIDRPRGSTWKEIRASIETDLDEVIDRKQKAVVMSALDYAHSVGQIEGVR